VLRNQIKDEKKIVGGTSINVCF